MSNKFSDEQIRLAKLRIDYKKSPIKFIEECVSIPTPGGDKPFIMYEPQKKMVQDFFFKHHLIVLKSRQIGISTITQAIITYICTFYKNVKIGIISRDRSEASDFCRKVVNMLDNLPEWLRPSYENKSIQYFVLKNGCELHTGAISPKNPTNTFRGKSLTMLVIDEAAFISYVDVAWTGIYPALSKAQKDAEEAGIPYGTLILSTPNKMEGTGSWYYRTWINAENNEKPEDDLEFTFHPVKIRWSDIPAFANDPTWYKKQCAMLGDKNKIAQELDMKFVGGEGSLFNEEIQIQLQNCGIVAEEYIPLPRGLGEVWKFCKINRKNFHIISVDCASAAGMDNSAVEVIEYETMNQVMEYKGKLATKEFADVIKIIALHTPNNVIVVENNGGYGDVVLTELLEDPDLEYNVYGEYKMVAQKERFIPGLNTNPASRKLMLDALFEIVTSEPHLIKSKRLASELLALTNKKSRIEADKGFHDDLAMAYAFACYIRQFKHEYIGTDSLTDDDLLNDNIMIKGETIRYAAELNNSTRTTINATYDSLYNPDNPQEFESNLNRYVLENLMAGNLNGYVNILDVWRDGY